MRICNRINVGLVKREFNNKNDYSKNANGENAINLISESREKGQTHKSHTRSSPSEKKKKWRPRAMQHSVADTTLLCQTTSNRSRFLWFRMNFWIYYLNKLCRRIGRLIETTKRKEQTSLRAQMVDAIYARVHKKMDLFFDWNELKRSEFPFLEFPSLIQASKKHMYRTQNTKSLSSKTYTIWTNVFCAVIELREIGHVQMRKWKEKKRKKKELNRMCDKRIDHYLGDSKKCHFDYFHDVATIVDYFCCFVLSSNIIRLLVGHEVSVDLIIPKRHRHTQHNGRCHRGGAHTTSKIVVTTNIMAKMKEANKKLYERE